MSEEYDFDKEDEDAVMAWLDELANDPHSGEIRGVAILAGSYKELADSQRLMLNAMINTLGTIRDMCDTLIELYERVENGDR